MTSIEKYKVNGSFNDQLDKNIIKEIEDIYKKIDSENEFEVMFFNYKSDTNRMGLEHFLKILEYLSFKSKRNNIKLENTDTLDINYVKQHGETYRITISGIESINKYIKMLHMRKNHVIFSVLAGLVQKDKTLRIMKKIKEKENMVDIDDFDVRIRLASENDVTKKELDELMKLDESVRSNISFRYKQRVSLKLEDTKDLSLSIDLTNIKMTKVMNYIENNVPIYELEIDMSTKSKNPDNKYLKMIYNEITILLKIIQQSNYIISKTMQSVVLDTYSKLFSVNKASITSLEGRKPQSLEVQHVVDQLPNKYAVTDKADGERYFLIIHDNVVFLISDLLNVKNTGIVLPESKSKYNNSILDGELIFIQSQNRYLYMSFDCLFNGGKDIRQESFFVERLKNVDDIVNNCFILKGQKGNNYEDYKGTFDTNEIVKFHANKIEKFMESLNSDMLLEKQYPLIRRKYFISALGGQNNEIFKYSSLMWNKYTKDKNINCPYILDGLIYHPLDQKYITSVKDSKYLEYKWKPEEKNSVDFYVQYERSRDNNKIVTLYDNSKDEEEQIRGKPYKILKLYVGKMIKGMEQPVLFEPENDSVKYLAYIFLQDGEVRDEMDNIIQDNTVVEFYYNNDPNIPDKHRWVPLRTRYDKTESVQRFGKKYGNYSDIAYKVWRSIRNPFTMNDIDILSKDDLYSKHNEILRGKIDHSVILSERKENVYYQIRTTLGKPMRNFHNWIKSILIYTFVNPMYEKDNKQLTVLDIACGRGGDLMKFYYGQVALYVGLDVNNNGLTSPVDGAVSRYNQLRKTHPNFPKMFFVHGDGGVLFNYEDQVKALGGMNDKNKQLFDQYFPKDTSKKFKFDRINCQFAVHYFFQNDLTFNNFCQNVCDHLKHGGYLLLTTFDADRIIELLADKSQHVSYYNTPTGEQKTFFEIVKKYENIKKGDDVGVGVAIDFHNALDFQEGVYVTEYLVQKKFIEKELLSRCGVELIETDLFENQYIINRDFFSSAYKFEDNEKTRKFLQDASEYYSQKSEVNSASYQLSRLYRYYVFRKNDNGKNEYNQNESKNKTVDKQKPSKNKAQKGGAVKPKENSNRRTIDSKDYVFNDATDLLNPKNFIKRDITGLNEFSFMTSIHDILKTQKIIPSNVPMMEFYDDISYKVFNDKDIDQNKITSLNKNLVIKHDYSVSDLSSEMALNGINLLVIKKDCDGFSTVEKYGPDGKFDRNIPTSLLYYDGNKYYPIYKIKDNETVGFFDSRMRFINDLAKK
jgi:SAM-dependent methyltransferase